jgi:hypothetical protein
MFEEDRREAMFEPSDNWDEWDLWVDDHDGL